MPEIEFNQSLGMYVVIQWFHLCFSEENADMQEQDFGQLPIPFLVKSSFFFIKEMSIKNNKQTF